MSRQQPTTRSRRRGNRPAWRRLGCFAFASVSLAAANGAAAHDPYGLDPYGYHSHESRGAVPDRASSHDAVAGRPYRPARPRRPSRIQPIAPARGVAAPIHTLGTGYHAGWAGGWASRWGSAARFAPGGVAINPYHGLPNAGLQGGGGLGRGGFGDPGRGSAINVPTPGRTQGSVAITGHAGPHGQRVPVRPGGGAVNGGMVSGVTDLPPPSGGP